MAPRRAGDLIFVPPFRWPQATAETRSPEQRRLRGHLRPQLGQNERSSNRRRVQRRPKTLPQIQPSVDLSAGCPCRSRA